MNRLSAIAFSKGVAAVAASLDRVIGNKPDDANTDIPQCEKKTNGNGRVFSEHNDSHASLCLPALARR